MPNARCFSCKRVSRVSWNDLGRDARCVHCGVVLPPQPSNIIAIATVWAAFGLSGLIVPLIYFTTESGAHHISEPAGERDSGPIPQRAWQGIYRVSDEYANVARAGRLTIESPRGANYFIQAESAITGEPVMSFFIRGGSSLKFKVPLENLRFKYCAGMVWYGESNLFGAGTKYFGSNPVFDFEEAPEGVSHHTLVLPATTERGPQGG